MEKLNVKQFLRTVLDEELSDAETELILILYVNGMFKRMDFFEMLERGRRKRISRMS